MRLARGPEILLGAEVELDTVAAEPAAAARGCAALRSFGILQTIGTAYLAALGRAIEAAPKSLRWKARARVGERVRWYEQPEETPHHS